ncbi:hypothetical protein MEBOL_001602 [Melittangium boletus DSM 14713]|uniref:Uncharacterized protein n=1 Tax=Melittangium boletus DSM 14713 TaxID=1294270 RepID=A0A250IB12_9BACT|nr:hypothetical protein MEBOL_001602 [Melittangium boletus DSM 14713]
MGVVFKMVRRYVRAGCANPNARRLIGAEQ